MIKFSAFILTSLSAIFSTSLAFSISLTELVTDLNFPVFITGAGDDSGRLFIVEQGGKIKIFKNNVLLETPFINIGSQVKSGGEEGLLGLAFHPRFKTNRRFYLYFNDKNGDIRINSYRALADNPDQATKSGAKRIIKIPHPNATNHNGGMIAFGADGYLYIATGDGGFNYQGNAQKLSSLLGKILRININTTSAYSSPKSNPFYNNPKARREIYAYGLRNPWRFSFDRLNDRLFAADVGQGSFEEINIIKSGANYGWSYREANACYQPATKCRSKGLTKPIAYYTRDQGRSITGGYVYRGATLQSLVGSYIFGDFISGKIWSLTLSKNRWRRKELLNTSLLISSFGQDDDGELYVVEYRGTIYKISN
jgi:glucose/arabinose dehydrogenase